MIPNGIIILYRIYIDGSSVQTTDQVVTVSSLQPFTTYSYNLEACTAVGCTNGTVTTIATAEGIPEGLAPPTFVPLSSESVEVMWTSPTNPNGVITHYEVFHVFGEDLSQTELVDNTTGFSSVVSDLSPSTLYYFKVVAHNSAGYVSSNISSIKTPEDTPEIIFPPNITVISSSSLLITWKEPEEPNGVITNYTLFRDLFSVFVGKANLSYIDTGLENYTFYSYFIVVCNSKGCGASTSSVERTAEASPEMLQEPAISSITSESAVISLSPVGKPNGIVSYILRVTGEFLINYEDNNVRQTITETRVVHNHTETEQVIIVENLLPFTSYDVQLEASTSAGSTFGDIVSFTTLQAGLFRINASMYNLYSCYLCSS